MLQKELECYQVWYCYHFCVDKKVQQVYIFTISISFVLQSKYIYIYIWVTPLVFLSNQN